MLTRLLSQIKAQWHLYKIIYIAISIYTFACVVITLSLNIEPEFAIGLIFLWFCVVVLFLFCSLMCVAKIFRILFSDRPQRPTRQLLEWVGAEIEKNNRVGNGCHGVIIFGLAIFIYSTVKSAIPSMNPFGWDEYFMKLDRYLFLGIDPWIITKYFLKDPYVTSAISLLYSNLWMIVIASVVTYSFFSEDDFRRVRFSLSCVLAWIVSGNIIAIGFSSAGPCYYEFVVSGMNPYAELMNYLREVNALTGAVVSLQVQDLLWSVFVDSGKKISAISAMPSLHIMFCFIVAFYIYDVNRTIGTMLYSYAIIVFIGSVYLAWHYAVDSIAAVLLAVLTWMVSGWILRRTQPPTRDAERSDVVG